MTLGSNPPARRGMNVPVPGGTSEMREVSHMRGYTVEQIAEMLHIGRDKVYVLLRTGQLRSIKIGRSRRITDRHLAEFVSSLEKAS
jgi:excisionase family DNA binding protein